MSPTWLFRNVYVVKQIGRDMPWVFNTKKKAIEAANKFHVGRGGDWYVIRQANSCTRAVKPKIVFRTDRCT